MRFVRTACCRFLLTGLVTWGAIGNATDVSERYGKYVNEVVRRAREIVERSAYVKELSLLVDRTSVAQSHLAAATQDIVNINEYARAATTKRADVCPLTANGTVDFRQASREVGALQQMINLRARSLDHVATFRAIDKSRTTACAEAKSFESYDIDSLGLQYYLPATTGVFDGVYVLWVSSDDGKRDQGAESIPLIGSLIRIIHNVDERSSIGESLEYLQRQGPTTNDYRRLAQEGCRKASAKFNADFDEYEKVARAVEGFAAKMDLPTIEKRIASLTECYARYESEYRDFLKARADELAQRRLDRTYAFRSDFQLKLATRINLRVSGALRRLSVSPDSACGTGRTEITAIQGDLALGRLYSLDLRALVARAARVVGERREKCGEEW